MAIKEISLKNFIIRIASDICALVLVWLPVVIFEKWSSPFQRGYYCSDESIMYPFRESTVSSFLLFGTTLGVTLFAIIIIESTRPLLRGYEWQKGDLFSNPLPLHITGFNKEIPSFVYQIYKCIMIYIIGYGINVLLTEVGKFSTGRLRPHFLAVCKPRTMLCAGREGDLEFSAGRLPYVSDPQCTAPVSMARVLRDSRLSFPSGYSSISMFSAVFLVLYLQARLPIHQLRALRLVLQAILIAAALFCCISRVSDNKHHPTDVLAGTLLGTLVAIFTVFYGLRLFGTELCGLRLMRIRLAKLEKVIVDSKVARVEAGEESALATSGRDGAEPDLKEEVLLVDSASPVQEMISVSQMRGPFESRSQGRPARRELKSDN